MIHWRRWIGMYGVVCARDANDQRSDYTHKCFVFSHAHCTRWMWRWRYHKLWIRRGYLILLQASSEAILSIACELTWIFDPYFLMQDKEARHNTLCRFSIIWWNLLENRRCGEQLNSAIDGRSLTVQRPQISVPFSIRSEFSRNLFAVRAENDKIMLMAAKCHDEQILLCAPAGYPIVIIMIF